MLANCMFSINWLSYNINIYMYSFVTSVCDSMIQQPPIKSNFLFHGDAVLYLCVCIMIRVMPGKHNFWNNDQLGITLE